jgi:hypothetical protein
MSLSTEEVNAINEATLETLRVNGAEVPTMRMDFKLGARMLGLKLVKEDIIYEENEEGEVIKDEKNKPVVLSRKMPVFDWAVTVKVKGLVDHYGTPIPEGKQYFRNTASDNNRPLTESNYTHLIPRWLKWAINGETMIIDTNEKNQSCQHRATSYCKGVLSGVIPVDHNPPVLLVTGVSPAVAMTIDTGKSNSGKDVFGSDPELCRLETLKSKFDYANDDDTDYVVVGYADPVLERKKIAGELESASKMLVLRLSGQNVNGSIKGGANFATEVAYTLASNIMPELDQLVAMTHAYVSDLKAAKPASVSEIATALALSQLGNHEPIDILPGKDTTGTPIDEVTPITFELDKAKAFLVDMVQGATSGEGVLGEWCANRVSVGRKKDSKVVKFAQLCKAVALHSEGEEVSADINLAKNTSSDGEAKNFYHFGGADRGPKPKKAKKDSE